MSQYDLALIDDDELIRMVWSMRARELNLKIAVFEHLVITTGDEGLQHAPPYIKSIQGKDFPAFL